MDTKELYDALKRASSALASKDDVPSFASFFFDGERVRAYDDEIAITVPCSLPVTGGIAGRPLLAWVSGLNGSDVTVELTEGGVKLKCGRSRIELPLISSKQEAYRAPEDEGVSMPWWGNLMLDGMQRCAPFMGTDSAHPWRMGLTVLIDNKEAELFATNNVAIVSTTSKVKLGTNNKLEVILLPRFVHQVISFSKASVLAALILGDGWAQATYADGTQLFSRTLGEAAARNYKKALESVLEEVQAEGPSTAFEVPIKLSGMLSTVDKVISAIKAVEVDLTIKNGKLMLSNKGSTANVLEVVDIKGDPPNIKVRIQPKVMMAAIDFVNQMAVIDRAVVMSGENFVFAMSVVGEE